MNGLKPLKFKPDVTIMLNGCGMYSLIFTSEKAKLLLRQSEELCTYLPDGTILHMIWATQLNNYLNRLDEMDLSYLIN